MNILVLGYNGQLGQEFLNSIDDYSDLKFNYSYIKDISKLNFDSFKYDPKYDIVINCAAYTDVAKAETDMYNCFKSNFLDLNNLIELCNFYKMKLVHFSTDYVFNNSNAYYIETDKPNPINKYGLSKYLGEELIKNKCNNYLIIRTSALFGRFGTRNFIYKIVNKMNNNEDIEVFDNSFCRPTCATDLVSITKKLLLNEKLPKQEIIHCAGSEVLSWYDYAELIKKIYNKNNKFPYLKKIKQIQIKNNSIYPKKVILSTIKLFKEYKLVVSSNLYLDVQSLIKYYKKD
jgi:dTDP-4-dehydrorhamnose reductase